MFLKKHWTFSKIPRDVFFKTTVSFFSGFYPIFFYKKQQPLFYSLFSSA